MRAVLLSILLLIANLTLANTGKKTVSTIEDVTVYLTGARIKRTADVSLKPGTNEILLHDLSPTINENSIQISGLKNVSILSINFGIDYLEKRKTSEELTALQKQLEQLLLEKNKLENIITGLGQEKKLLENNQRIASTTESLSLEKVKEISAYYRDRAIEIQNETYTHTQKIDRLSDEISAITQQIDKLDDDTKEQRGEIKVKLDAPVATTLSLVIQYNVTQAGWFPLYDIKSQSIKDPIKMAYKANVYQQTGTPWNNVNITLSTGDPNTNNIKPNVSPKYLNFSYGSNRQQNAIKRYGYQYNPTVKTINGIVLDDGGLPLPGVNVIEKGTSNGTQTDFDGRYTLEVADGRELSFSYIGFSSQSLPIYSSVMNISLEEDTSVLDEVVIAGYSTSGSSGRYSPRSSYTRKKEKKEYYNEVVEVKEEGITNTRFKIKKKYSIPSNADITIIEIDNFEIRTDYNHYVAPELNENVFLTAKLANWEQFNLLAGEANIYFEGSYAGKTNIDPLHTTDTLTVSLGVDPNIVVKREQLKNFKSKNFTGNSKIVNRAYKITIKNNKKSNINITVEDRIPVSQNKDIKLDEVQTDQAVYDSKKGIMTWKLDVQANQKLEKQFSYQVKHPRSRRISL